MKLLSRNNLMSIYIIWIFIYCLKTHIDVHKHKDILLLLIISLFWPGIKKMDYQLWDRPFSLSNFKTFTHRGMKDGRRRLNLGVVNPRCSAQMIVFCNDAPETHIVLLTSVTQNIQWKRKMNKYFVFLEE